MTIVTASAALNMDNLAAILAPIANQSTYSNVSASGFTAKGGGALSPSIKVEGTFALIPGTSTVISGTIDKITVIGLGGSIVFTPDSSHDLWLTLVGALKAGNASTIDALLGGSDNITGSGVDDLLRGGKSADGLHGGGGLDTIYGGDFNDNLFGDDGNDNLFGDAGGDWLYGGKGLDRIDGGTETDTVDYSSATAAVQVTLSGATFARVKVAGKVVDLVKNVEAVVGGKAGDSLTGDGGSNALDGRGGKDVLRGGVGMDTLVGGAGKDKLVGGADFDVLIGGTGNDRLTGGAGSDWFEFYDALNAKTNVDTITDFKTGEDYLVLSKAVFSAFLTSPSGYLAYGSAKDANDYLIYKPGSGDLLYDPDGSAGGKAILFAHLPTGLALTEAQFQFF